MQTLSLRFDGLDYPMIAIKWKVAKASSQACVNKKRTIWKSLEVM